MSLVEGINAEDILYSNFLSSSKTFGKLPNHFIVLDHEKQAVVLSFRGTFSLSEAITDVNCQPVAFSIGGEEGFAHVAMANGARMAMSVLEDVILAVTACYPAHRLRIVGHSLGAGVAAIFAIMLKEKHPRLPIECWAFGCPGVLSLNLARKVETYFDNGAAGADDGGICSSFSPPLSFMQAFSAGDDNIPRLSHGSILDLTSMADTLWEFFDSKRDGCWSALRYSVKSSESWLKWAVDVTIIVVFVSCIAIFGYTAKAVTFLQGLFPSWRSSLLECPEHLKEASELLNPSHAGTVPYHHGEGEREGDRGSSEFRRLPTLFAKISANPHESRVFEDDSGRSIDLLEACANGDETESPRDRLLRTFSEVVCRASSGMHRDKLVKKAAKKFLMAAHHGKLYPPANVYHIQFGPTKDKPRLSFSKDPLQYYGLERSRPEYFGWLLFSVGMLFHHMPRSYLHALSVLRASIRVRRERAQSRWSAIRRKTYLARYLSLYLGSYLGESRFSLGMVSRLERASGSFRDWVGTIEMAGQIDDIHLPNAASIGRTRKSVKDRMTAKSRWKRARVKTSAVQHLSRAEQDLQDALKEVVKRQKEQEVLAEAGGSTMWEGHSSLRDLGSSSLNTSFKSET